MRIQHISMQAGTEKILVEGWGPDLQTNCPEVNNVTNFKGENNYTVLDVEGTGHYVGCNLTVKHYQGSWWGEGNDMFFIDGEEYPSLMVQEQRIISTHAWGMQKNAYPFFGTIVHESDTDGFQVSYRFHITDPVRFEKHLKLRLNMDMRTICQMTGVQRHTGIRHCQQQTNYDSSCRRENSKCTGTSRTQSSDARN